MNIKVRHATEKDLGSIAELWKELMDFHKVMEPLFTRHDKGHETFIDIIKENIASDKAGVFVAETGREIIGLCRCVIDEYPPLVVTERCGNVKEFTVAAKYRRKGVGEKMISAAKEWFKSKGVDRLEVRFTMANEISSKFWPKMGFKPILKTAYMEI